MATNRQATPDILGNVLGPVVDDTAIIRQQLRYDYDQLGAVGPAVQEHAVAIKSHERKANEAVIEAGRHLIAVKESLQHGQWEDWLRVEFSMTDRTARTMMTIAERFDGKTEKISVLGTSVLGLLASPSVPDVVVEKVIEVAATEGKISVTRAKQIIHHQKFLDAKANHPAQPQRDDAAEDAWTAKQEVVAARGWGTGGYAAMWELEREVREVYATFYRDDNERRNAPADMRAAARMGMGGFYTTALNRLGSRAYRKGELVQAINNVANQLEQQQKQPAGRPLMEVIKTDDELAAEAQAADIASREAAADEATRQAQAAAAADVAFGMAPTRTQVLAKLLQDVMDAIPELSKLSGKTNDCIVLQSAATKIYGALVATPAPTDLPDDLKALGWELRRGSHTGRWYAAIKITGEEEEIKTMGRSDISIVVEDCRFMNKSLQIGA